MVFTNSPVTPEFRIPVTVLANGTPVLLMGGDLVTLESKLDFRDAPVAGVTQHLIPVTVEPATDASVLLKVAGDFLQANEYATVTLEGLELGEVGRAGGYYCTWAEAVLELATPDLTSRAVDGLLELEVVNSPAVDVNRCNQSTHSVLVSYRGALEQVDFGMAYVGRPMTTSFTVESAGTETLQVSALQADHADISLSHSSLELVPGASAVVTVTLTPSDVGILDGKLTLMSDDPGRAVVEIPLTGTILQPPVMELDRETIAVTLVQGESVVERLEIGNSGPGALDYEIGLLQGAQPFVSLDITAGQVEPGNVHTIHVALDTAGLTPGLHQASLAISTNDSHAPLVEIPLMLTVLGIPQMQLRGAELTDVSSISYEEAGAQTVHGFEFRNPPVGSAFLDVLAFGKYYYDDRFSTISLEGTLLGQVGDYGEVGATCSDSSWPPKTINLPAPLMAAALADGTLTVEVTNSPDVEYYYPCSHHRVSMTYRPGIEHHDFGKAFLGRTRSFTVEIENTGSGVLELTPTSSSIAFTMEPPQLQIEPGGMETLTILFSPEVDGSVQGSMTMASNDPTRPAVTMEVQGEGIDAGRGRVTPTTLDVSLPYGGSESRRVILFNEGGRSLEYSTVLSNNPYFWPGGMAPVAEGTLAPGASIELEYIIQANGGLGQHTDNLLIYTNSPTLARIYIPVVVTIFGVPKASLSAVPIDLPISSSAFSSEQPLSRHSFDLPAPPQGNATITVVVEGNYLAEGQSATVTLDGLELGSMPLEGRYICDSFTRKFNVSAGQFAVLSADHHLEVAVENKGLVGGTCANRHRVEIEYNTPPKNVEFGNVFTGSSRQRLVEVRNVGNAPMEVFALESDEESFQTDQSTFTLNVNEARTVAVTFTPPGPGNYSGSLSLSSNSLVNPLIALPISGSSMEGPALQVSPSAFDLSVPDGGSQVTELTITNEGSTHLEAIVQADATAWLQPGAGRITLEPSGAVSVPIHVNSAGQGPGVHLGEIVVRSNDPQIPELVVSVQMTVLPGPNLLLHGETASRFSSKLVTGNGYSTRHQLPIEVQTGGEMEVIVDVSGILRRNQANVSLEGVWLGWVRGTSGTCGSSQRGTFMVPDDLVKAAAADGILEFTVYQTSMIRCSGDHHDIQIHYEESLEPLELGEVQQGGTLNHMVSLENIGSAPLEIHGAVSSLPDLSIDLDETTLLPGASLPINLLFVPAQEGAFQGVLTVSSNDPDEPLMSVPVRASATGLPLASVSPMTLDAQIAGAGIVSRTLTLVNSGSGPLEFNITQSLPDKNLFRVDILKGSIAPFESQELTVSLRSMGSTADTASTQLEIFTDDPANPQLVVPITISSMDGPRIEIYSAVDNILSYKPFSSRTTSHQFHFDDRPPGDGTFYLSVSGDFGSANETARFVAEGNELATVGNLGEDCSSATVESPVFAADLASMAADRVISVSGINTSAVSSYLCSPRFHRVRLKYGSPLEALDFGTVQVGEQITRTFTINNGGSLELGALAVSTDNQDLDVGVPPETLLPGYWQELTVTLVPTEPGPISGFITVYSDDPIMPEWSIPITGQAQVGPQASVSMEDLTLEVPFGYSGDHPILVGNTGGVTLDYTVSFETSGPAFVDLLPTFGAVEPGGSSEVTAMVQATGLATGNYQGDIVLASNDPAHPEIRIPVSMTVVTRPHLALLGQEVVQESRQDFTVDDRITDHVFDLADVSPSEALITLQAIGDFVIYYSAATLRIEDQLIGYAGGPAPPCGEVSREFSLSEEDLAGWLQDGVLNAQVTNSAGIRDTGCPDNFHALTLRYRRAADRLDFSETFIGMSTTLTMVATNAGNETLLLSNLATDRPDFQVLGQDLSVAPGESSVISVTFVPAGQGEQQGILTLDSSDPEQPHIQVPLQGEGVQPPIVRLDAESFQGVASEHRVTEFPFTIYNDGGSPLSFEIHSDLLPQGSIVSEFQGLDPDGSGEEMPDDPVLPEGNGATSVVVMAGDLGDVAFDGAPESGRADISLSTGEEQLPEIVTPVIGMTAVYQPQTAPPVVLTGLVADPDRGHIYGQERDGPRFFRFVANEQRWEEMLPAPFFSAAAGGAILNGKIYMSYSREGVGIGAYDIQSGSWETTLQPMKYPTTAITSDGFEFLYLAMEDDLVRMNPDTLLTQDLPRAPIGFHYYGSLEYFEGVLYGHTGFGQVRAASYDIAGERWTRLPDIPASSSLGATIDPINREFVMYGPAHGNSLYRYSIDREAWSVSTVPGASFNDVHQWQVGEDGIAWLPSPGAGIYLTDAPSGFIRMLTAGSSVRTSVEEGIIPAGSSLAVSVQVDTHDLRLGTASGTVTLSTNDPVHPQISLPLDVQIVGVPQIQVMGRGVQIASGVDFSTSATLTHHSFVITKPPMAGPASLELVLEGDFGDPGENATVLIEGSLAGEVAAGRRDCSRTVRHLQLDPDALAVMVADGFLEVELQNSEQVNAFCEVNRHQVTLSYTSALTSLTFEPAFAGHADVQALEIRNLGQEELHLDLLAGDRPEITVSPAAAIIPPLGSLPVTVTLLPQSLGTLNGQVQILSNDPDTPELLLGVTAQVVEAPGATLPEVSALAAALPSRTPRIRTKTIQLGNDGGSPLEWNLTAQNLFPAINTQAVTAWQPRPKGDESDNGTGNISAFRSAGPDAMGYRFRDSDETDGPEFQWIDLSENGLDTWLTGDDQNSGPVALGFDFPFYGTQYDTVNISTNGWLSFTSQKTSYSNASALPSTGYSVPENLIAPFWDDLIMRSDSRIQVLQDGDRFIVQFTSMDRFSSLSRFTFQVVLHEDGRIVYQYLYMSGELESATVGIQNGSKDVGLLAAANSTYVRNGLAVEFLPVPAWMTSSATEGILEPGEATDIDVTFSAANLDPADYQALLRIETNDPLHRDQAIPVTLHVGEVALRSLKIDPETLNLSSSGMTLRAAIELPTCYDPHVVRIDTVSIEGVVFANPAPIEFKDVDDDGHEELVVKFDRQAFVAGLPDLDEIPVIVTGEVEDVTWFRGQDTIRTIRPRLSSPNGGEHVVLGAPVEIRWDPVEIADAYTVAVSRDQGVSWEDLTGSIQGSSLTWEATGLPSAEALFRVSALSQGEVIGYDTSDANVYLVHSPTPPRPVESLGVWLDGDDVVFTWLAPGTDATHGPADFYRILRSTGRLVPFAETTTTLEPLHRESMAPGPEGPVVFFKVVPANEAGSAQEK